MAFPDSPHHDDPDDQSPQQNQVRGLLAGLPDPGPMPDDLVTRIHARLADEELSRHADGDVVDLSSRRRARLMGAVAAIGGVAAAAAVIGVVTTGGLDSLDGKNANDTLHVASSSVTARGFADVRIHQFDRHVTEATVDSEASRLIGYRANTAVEPGTAAFGSLGTVPGLQSCLASLGVTSPRTIAAGIEKYEGKPAVVAGVRTTDGELQAWVVDPSCKELVPHRVIN